MRSRGRAQVRMPVPLRHAFPFRLLLFLARSGLARLHFAANRFILHQHIQHRWHLQVQKRPEQNAAGHRRHAFVKRQPRAVGPSKTVSSCQHTEKTLWSGNHSAYPTPLPYAEQSTAKRNRPQGPRTRRQLKCLFLDLEGWNWLI